MYVVVIRPGSFYRLKDVFMSQRAVCLCLSIESIESVTAWNITRILQASRNTERQKPAARLNCTFPY